MNNLIHNILTEAERLIQHKAKEGEKFTATIEVDPAGPFVLVHFGVKEQPTPHVDNDDRIIDLRHLADRINDHPFYDRETKDYLVMFLNGLDHDHPAIPFNYLRDEIFKSEFLNKDQQTTLFCILLTERACTAQERLEGAYWYMDRREHTYMHLCMPITEDEYNRISATHKMDALFEREGC